MRNIIEHFRKIEYNINLSLPSHVTCYRLYHRYELGFAGLFGSETMLMVIENLVPIKMTPGWVVGVGGGDVLASQLGIDA